MAPHSLGDQVDDPILPNAMRGVEPRLHVEVITKSRVADLD